MYTSNDLVKPIMIITCDGGPDENPRYQKTISCAIDYSCSYDLDALFIGTNAPDRSAFNRVEHRIAPLSHDLAGIILRMMIMETTLITKVIQLMSNWSRKTLLMLVAS